MAGGVLLLLAISGFFLDHDRWSFLYTIEFSNYPKSLKHYDNRLVNRYIIHDNTTYVAGMKGVYEKKENQAFIKRFSLPVYDAKIYNKRLYLATTDGIYKNYQPYLLPGKNITALSIANNTLVAVIDKRELFVYDLEQNSKIGTYNIFIDPKELGFDITLSRFVRDLHYGRGIFDGDLSLYLNDYGALVLAFLALSGYFIWFLIQKRKTKTAKRVIRLHANIVVIVATFSMIILAVTGIFLDHAKALQHFMKSITIPSAILPPVYSSLQSDIWSVDYDGKRVRIGNRYGVYGSDDFKEFHLENRGFAYKMDRVNTILYISGMGAPNRVFQHNRYKILPNTPHMFKSVVEKDGKLYFFSSHKQSQALPLPQTHTITLYSIILALHSGEFFASWWVWINDIASFLLFLLIFTGILRYMKKKRVFQKS